MTKPKPANFTRNRFNYCFLILCQLGWLVLALGRSYGADAVSIKTLDGHIMLCEVIKMSKAGVVLKTDGKEQTLPLELLSLPEVQECYKRIENKDAALRFDMGAYFLKKQLMAEAGRELNEAVKLDPKLADKAAPLLKTIEAKKAPVPVPAETSKKDDISKPPELPKEPIKDPAKEPVKEPDKTTPGESATEKPADGTEDLTQRILIMEVPPRTPAEMKEFLQKRLEELKKEIGGNWRMIETPHFYCFSNLADEFHQKAAVWNEKFYDIWCSVLQHKEGDKLWNNKCPIYYFHSYAEFQKFASEIDHGMAMSGGYFMHRGREVHICIPFYSEHGGERGTSMLARNTFKHEGTHAFLQVSGEDVPISSSIHEGLAQFMQFWKFQDDDKCPERARMVAILSKNITAGNIPSWEMMQNRPLGGTDLDGYAWALAKMEFLYYCGGRTRLPKMIRLIKAGKTEAEAMAGAYDMSVDKLEKLFHDWLTDMSKKNFPRQD